MDKKEFARERLGEMLQEAERSLAVIAEVSPKLGEAYNRISDVVADTYDTGVGLPGVGLGWMREIVRDADMNEEYVKVQDIWSTLGCVQEDLNRLLMGEFRSHAVEVVDGE